MTKSNPLPGETKVLNFEIVSSIGSSAGYGRISQQQEILYGFCLFCYSLVCKVLVLRWPNVNLFVNILLGPIYFQQKGQFILNIAELTKGTREYKGFSKELSLDFGEWSEAAENCFPFHQMQETTANMCVDVPLISIFFSCTGRQDQSI
jgi:hypothetical protein